MKIIRWDNDKNAWLKQNRKISFEDILWSLQNDLVLDVILNPNQERYPNQEMSIIFLNDYVYVVPFEENEEEIYLKTVFPSRKFTKVYL